MGAFDELLSAWRSNPDAETTQALCTYLGAHPNEDIVREVGSRAEQWHAADPDVMLAVGRMYLDATLLTEAQAALVVAGKVNARDPRPFRYLGEVLLRRGDALRSEKVLKRAIELGPNDGDTRMWHDRAVVYVALQKRVGMQAVASEVSRTLPKNASLPPPPMAPPSARPPPSVRAAPPPPARAGAPPAPARPRPQRPPWGVDEAPTLPKSSRLALGARPPVAVAAGPGSERRPRTVPPPLPPQAAGDVPTAVMSPQMMRTAQARALAPEEATETTLQHAVEPWVAEPGEAPGGGLAPRTPLGGFSAQRPVSGTAPAYVPPPAPASGLPAWVPPAAPDPAPSAGYGAGPRVPHSSLEIEDGFEASAHDAPNPPPDMVLQHLARVGVYEPGGGAPPAWESAPKTRTRGNWVFIMATVLLVGAGGGGWYYARHVQTERADKARQLADEVDAMLHSGKPDELRATDDKLARIFDLDSRSQRAARLWLENRVLQALLLSDEPRGIDAAVHRGLTVGLEEKDVAFGKIASFLAEGDIAGAAAILPKYDKLAEKDAFFHLAAGAALERAGDLRAIERYEAARALDNKLIAADVLLTRAVLLELGIEKGKKPLEEAKKKMGDTPTTRTLSALAWAVDPNRPKELPKDALIKDEERTSLSAPLRPVPYVVDALQAINAGYEEKAAIAIDTAINLTMSPAMATQLGFLAIKAGNEKLARQAALRALQFSALYPSARVLASRVALLGGRLDEAKKAIEELDPRSADVAIVRAALAYETLDSGELRSAVEALGEAGKNPEYEAITAARGVLGGTEYPGAEKIEALASPQIPWGEVVAVDAAIATGNLELADKLVTAWGDAQKRPVYALRVSRLRRHQNKLDDAMVASSAALERGTTTLPVIIERVYVLVAKGEASRARDLIAKYLNLVGPIGTWLKAYVDASSNREGDAKALLGQSDPPPPEAPLEIRLLAARALGAAGEKRARGYIREVARSAPKHPELLAAAK